VKEPSAITVEAVRLRLSELSQPAAVLVAARVLVSLGYEQVETVPRGGRRGLFGLGGVDLIARRGGELSRPLVLAQVRRYTLQRHFVDELRGALLRKGASEGIAFTTERATTAAYRAAEEYRGRSVRIVDGEEFARHAVAAGVGIRVSDQGTPEVDGEYFDRLESRVPRARKPEPALVCRVELAGPFATVPPPEPPRPDWLALLAALALLALLLLSA
jgi:hypothetical protein